jgi:predicted ATPase
MRMEISEMASDAEIDAALEAYNEVWAVWKEITVDNVEQCRRAAMIAALDAAEIARAAELCRSLDGLVGRITPANVHAETVVEIG